MLMEKTTTGQRDPAPVTHAVSCDAKQNSSTRAGVRQRNTALSFAKQFSLSLSDPEVPHKLYIHPTCDGPHKPPPPPGSQLKSWFRRIGNRFVGADGYSSLDADRSLSPIHTSNRMQSLFTIPRMHFYKHAKPPTGLKGRVASGSLCNCLVDATDRRASACARCFFLLATPMQLLLRGEEAKTSKTGRSMDGPNQERICRCEK